jgi:hypothetical protein
MDFWIGIAVSVLLQVLQSRKDIEKSADAIAKVYVRIKRTVEVNPTLAAAVTRQEAK